MNGGYIMVDCTELDLTKGSTEQTITGIYSKVKNAMNKNKPIYAVNAKWGNLKVSPIQVFAIQTSANTITVTSSTLQIIISTSDVITINNLVS